RFRLLGLGLLLGLPRALLALGELLREVIVDDAFGCDVVLLRELGLCVLVLGLAPVHVLHRVTVVPLEVASPLLEVLHASAGGFLRVFGRAQILLRVVHAVHIGRLISALLRRHRGVDRQLGCLVIVLRLMELTVGFLFVGLRVGVLHLRDRPL